MTRQLTEVQETEATLQGSEEELELQQAYDSEDSEAPQDRKTVNYQLTPDKEVNSWIGSRVS